MKGPIFHEWLHEALKVFWEARAQDIVMGQRAMVDGVECFVIPLDISIAKNSKGEDRIVYPVHFQSILNRAILAYENAKEKWQSEARCQKIGDSYKSKTNGVIL